jgi:hypothetical protein
VFLIIVCCCYSGAVIAGGKEVHATVPEHISKADAAQRVIVVLFLSFAANRVLKWMIE